MSTNKRLLNLLLRWFEYARKIYSGHKIFIISITIRHYLERELFKDIYIYIYITHCVVLLWNIFFSFIKLNIHPGVHHSY